MAELPAVNMPLIGDDCDVARTTRAFLNNFNLPPPPEDLDRAGSPGAALGGPPLPLQATNLGGT